MVQKLSWCTARGAVALERLQEDASSDLVYTFTKPWSDGTTGTKLALLAIRLSLSGWREGATP